jgi:hypothetical protein
MTQVSKQAFDNLERTIQQLKTDSSHEKIKELEARIKDLEARLDARPAVLQAAEDVARIEAIFDIMVRSDVTTQEEIGQYLDMYPQFWEAILEMLISKGLTTEKQFFCHLLAYHHMIRAYGLNPARNKVDLFNERIKYAEELEKLLEPVKMIGR